MSVLDIIILIIKMQTLWSILPITTVFSSITFYRKSRKSNLSSSRSDTPALLS
jgi:hypothetical protein